VNTERKKRRFLPIDVDASRPKHVDQQCRHRANGLDVLFIGMEVIPRAGTVFAWEDDRPLVTPYDDCVLIMPASRMHRGQTAVRLGRFIRGDREEG
jgi:hypothetical protein